MANVKVSAVPASLASMTTGDGLLGYQEATTSDVLFSSTQLPAGPTGATGDTGPTGPTGPAGSGGPQTAQVELSSADLLVLSVIPVLIVPAPGAGNVLSLVSVMYDFTFGTTAYMGSDNAGLYYGPTTDTAVDTGFLAGATAISFIIVEPAVIGGGVPESLDNIAFYLCVASPLTLGDGTLKVTANYLTLTR